MQENNKKNIVKGEKKGKPVEIKHRRIERKTIKAAKTSKKITKHRYCKREKRKMKGKKITTTTKITMIRRYQENTHADQT